VFYLTKPDGKQIEDFRRRAGASDFTYPSVGATRTETLPSGYVVDRNRVALGTGRATFEKAVAALQRWEMFNLGWVKLMSQVPPQEGLVVAIRCSHLGFWSLNACRVIYVVNEIGGTTGDAAIPAGEAAAVSEGMITFGFGYGTLKDHAESGEERFLIQWDSKDDTVYYDILAFSKSAKLVVRMGYWFGRSLQLRFARDSKQVMQRAVVGAENV